MSTRHSLPKPSAVLGAIKTKQLRWGLPARLGQPPRTAPFGKCMAGARKGVF